MTSASPSLPSAEPKRRQFGTYSFALAVLAVVLFTVAFGVVTRVTPASEAALWFFMLVTLLIVPLMHLAGIVLGIAALFRTGDRKVLGLLAAVLNLFLLGGGLVLGIIMAAHLGGR